jgi:MrcB-like, N-terminal domain/Domain of unknown function (DUF3883)
MSTYNLSPLFERIFALQDVYTHENSPAMQERGILIRSNIPDLLKAKLSNLRRNSGIKDLSIEGSDGTGLKSEVPWIRLYSPNQSKSAQDGWYVVFLFHANGEGVSLTLQHASTQNLSMNRGADFRPRTSEQIRELMLWASKQIPNDSFNRIGLKRSFSLGARGRVGRSYEETNVCGFSYLKNFVPSDDEVFGDVVFLLKLLKVLYLASESDVQMPGIKPPEIKLLENEIEIAAGNGGKVGRKRSNFNLSGIERKVIEKHAVKVAIDSLKELGFRNIKDVGKTESYDLVAEKDGNLFIFEVKGTTSNGDRIILTRNEVMTHQQVHPNNGLIIVKLIRLVGGLRPRASEGKAVIFSPWQIKTENLKPLAFDYLVGQEV